MSLPIIIEPLLTGTEGEEPLMTYSVVNGAIKVERKHL